MPCATGAKKVHTKIDRTPYWPVFSKNCPFGCLIVDATPKRVTMWVLSNETDTCQMKKGILRITLYLQGFLASEK